MTVGNAFYVNIVETSDQQVGTLIHEQFNILCIGYKSESTSERIENVIYIDFKKGPVYHYALNILIICLKIKLT